MADASPSVVYVSDATPAALGESASAMGLQAGEGLCLLLCEREAADLEEVVRELAGRGIRFFGATFPALLYQGQRLDHGGLLMKVPLLADPLVMAPGQTADIQALSATLLNDKKNGLPDICMMVFVDGLSPNVADLLETVFDAFGTSVQYLGGGGGRLSFEQQPCVFTRAGVFQDAAVIAPMAVNTRTAVQHGWRRLQGPFVVTRSEGNRIEELNWESAGSVYGEVVGAETGLEVGPAGFFDVAKAYPFGMFRERAEDVVRDPVALTPDGALVCVGDVPQHSVVHILHGEPDSLIEAAHMAGRACIAEPSESPFACFVADCISRTLFLGDRFSEEIRAVQAAIEPLAIPMVGALTLGEIAGHGGGHLEFFNKTIVVAALERHGG